MTRIAITGARGVLGRALRQRWTSAEWLPFAGDVRDPSSVRDWITSCEPIDALIHFAAVVPTARVQADPHAAFATNAGGTLNVVEAMRGRSLWMFYCSTSHVYAPSERPLREDDRLDPVSVYGATKLAGEQIAATYARWFALQLCIGRIFSYTAPDQPESYFVPAVRKRIEAAAHNARIAIRGGLQVRDFVTVDEISDAIEFLFRRRATGVYNIASGRGQMLLDVAKRTAADCGRADVSFDAEGEERGQLVADVAKLQALRDKEKGRWV